MLNLLLTSLLLFSTPPDPCAAPTMRLLADGRPITPAGAPFASHFTVRLTRSPACPNALTYQVQQVTLVLTRAHKPVAPAIQVMGPDVAIPAWSKLYQPGDEVLVEVKQAETIAPGNVRHLLAASAAPLTLTWRLTR